MTLTSVDELPSICRTTPNKATDSAVANRIMCPTNHRPKRIEFCFSGKGWLGARITMRCTMNPIRAEAIAHNTMADCMDEFTACAVG